MFLSSLTMPRDDLSKPRMSGAKKAAGFMLIPLLVAVLLAGSPDWAHADLTNVRNYSALDLSHVETDSTGRVITLDIIDNTVSIIGPFTNATQYINLGFVPSTLAVGPDDKIYVGYRNDDRIAVYNSDGTPDGHIQFVGSNILLHPQEHAVNSDGTSFVFMDDFETIDVYGSDRAIDQTIVDYQHNGVTFLLRTNILADAPNGDFVMSSSRNKHVVVFTFDRTQNEFVTKFVISETTPGTALDVPMGLAINPDGLIFVHDGNGIHVFNPDGTYVKTHQSPPGVPVFYMTFLGYNLLISHNADDLARSYAVDCVDDESGPGGPAAKDACLDPDGNGGAGQPDPADRKKKNGGGSDHKKRPTFGISHETNSQLVQNGFAFNGYSLTITDNYHTDFVRTSSVIGEQNHVSAKLFAPDGLREFRLSLGIPELGQASSAESEVTVPFSRNYDTDSTFEAGEISYSQKEPLVYENGTSASISKAKCNASSNSEDCLQVDLFFTVMAPLKHDVLAVTAVDEKRRSQTTYLNEGVEFTGESLLDPATGTVWHKATSQDKGLTIHLMQPDRRYNVWTDQNGFEWKSTGGGGFEQVTFAEFERHADATTSVMNRMHSNFENLIKYEADRAIGVFDSATIQSDVGGYFAYEFPDVAEKKLDDAKILYILEMQELEALQFLQSTP